MVIHTFMKIIHVITLSEAPSESRQEKPYLVHLFLNQKQFFQLDPKSYSLDMASHECWLHTETKGIVRRFNMNVPTLRLFKQEQALNFKGGLVPLQWRGVGSISVTDTQTWFD